MADYSPEASLGLTSVPDITLLPHYLKFSPTSSCLVLETCTLHLCSYWPFFVLTELVNLLQLTLSIFGNNPHPFLSSKKCTISLGFDICYLSCHMFPATYQTDFPPLSGQPLILKTGSREAETFSYTLSKLINPSLQI